MPYCVNCGNEKKSLNESNLCKDCATLINAIIKRKLLKPDKIVESVPEPVVEPVPEPVRKDVVNSVSNKRKQKFKVNKSKNVTTLKKSYFVNKIIQIGFLPVASLLLIGLFLGLIFSSVIETPVGINSDNDGDDDSSYINELEISLKNIQSKFSTAQNELASTKQLNNDLIIDNDLLTEKIQQYGDLEATIYDINIDLEIIENEKAGLESEIKNNLDEIANLDNQLQANNILFSQKEIELNDLSFKLENLENTQQQLENRKSSLESEVNSLKDQIEDLNFEVRSLEDSNVDLEELNAELQEKLDDAVSTSIENSDEVRFLANTLEQSVVAVHTCYYWNGYTTVGILGQYHFVNDKYYYCVDYGTGFFISTNGCLLTNAHVASGDGFIETNVGILERIYIIELSNGDMKKAYSLKVLGTTNDDLSLLRINSFSSTPVKLAVSHPVAGDQIVTVGHPSLLGHWVRATGEYESRSGDNYYLELPVFYGASGSPVINMDNELIGIIKQMQLKDPIVPSDDVIISKHNYGKEQYERLLGIADNVFEIKSFLAQTVCV